ncbi:HDIG domain-containing protein [Omnitrophica bacterium]|nr:HDIG domain-containing protein [Candidatus Omnitrophota bacterium]
MKSMKENKGFKFRNPSSARQSLDFRGWLARGLIFAFSAFLVAGILLYRDKEGVGDRKFVIGEPSPQTIFAPFAVSYEDEIATEVEREKKSQAVPTVYSVDSRSTAEVMGRINQLFLALEAEKTDAPLVQVPSEAPPPVLPVDLSDANLKYLRQEAPLQQVREALQILLEKTFLRGVLSEEDTSFFRAEESGVVTVILADKTQLLVPSQEVLSFKEVLKDADQLLPESAAKNRPLKKVVLDIFEEVFIPNLVKDETETGVRRQKAAASASVISDRIKKDELVSQRGRLVTPKEKQRIDAIQSKLVQKKILNELIATGVFVALAYFLCFVYLYQFERKIFCSLRRVLLIQSALILTVLICRLVLAIPGSSVYLMPSALASLMLVMLIGPRTGILAAILMAFFIAPLSGFQMDLVFSALAAGLAATFTAHRLSKRTHFLKVGFGIGMAQALVIFIFQFFNEVGFLESGSLSVMGLANGLLITIPLCFLMLPFFESAFNSITDMTLLELSDLNHPLLKKMIVQAPGTYHHSLIVSTLAESACKGIGANSLLARVGCYFHDIGKISRSDYFIENINHREKSKHEGLTPTMSFLMILNHVKGGVTLGRQYKLREPILRFIPEHHGTGVVWYFYKKAIDQARPGQVVQSDSFRYPGPKPQSRETAVALLADSTEAAARTLTDPTPESIRQLSRKIINDKFIDGQLDECDLTLKDLHRIQESFVQNLLAIYHTRIRYPAQTEPHDKPDLFENNQFAKFRHDPDSGS